jgi:tetratricopeptide (TPR) repeat protein
MWHQAVAEGGHWTVVSFHTAATRELVEERPDAANSNALVQQRYVDSFETVPCNRLLSIDDLWNYNEPEESERRFRNALPDARRSGDRAYEVELRTQLARAVCLQRRYEEAHAILDDAEPLLSAAMSRPRIRVLLERGRILNDTLRTAEALECFQEAWRLAESTPETLLAADVLHMLAYVTAGEESIRWHQTAIDFCQQQPGEPFRRWQSSLHMNLADKFEELGDYGTGLVHVHQSFVIAESLGWTARVIDAKNIIARLKRLSGDVAGAISLIEELIKIDSPRGYVCEEYAECLLALGRESEARQQFQRAYELLSKDPWYSPTQTERLERMRRLGDYMK